MNKDKNAQPEGQNNAAGQMPEGASLGTGFAEADKRASVERATPLGDKAEGEIRGQTRSATDVNLRKENTSYCSAPAAPSEKEELEKHAYQAMQILGAAITGEDHGCHVGNLAEMAQEVSNLLKAARSATPAITDNDKRWRFLEHGCQWVSWTPINGQTVSFDPRNLTGYSGDLNDMRGQADIELRRHLAILRAAADNCKAQEGKDGA